MYVTAVFYFSPSVTEENNIFKEYLLTGSITSVYFFIFDIYLEKKLGRKKNHIYELRSPKVSIVFIHNL